MLTIIIIITKINITAAGAVDRGFCDIENFPSTPLRTLPALPKALPGLPRAPQSLLLGPALARAGN